MAWERAKGELEGILQTYRDNEEEEYEEISARFVEFIQAIEENW